MKLSREEELFLRHWMHDEVHYLGGVGPAKRLQVEHGVTPADLATLVAAALPDPDAQQEAAANTPAEPPRWPWPNDDFYARLTEAHTVLDARAPRG